MGSNARREMLDTNDNGMEVFLDMPSGAGPFPAIVVAHHRAGIDAATTKFVQDLAANGYVAVAPDLHHRRPEGEDTRVSLQNLNDVQIVGDINNVVSFLQKEDLVDNERLGIAGHCMGGRVSFLGAAYIKAFKCNIVYYGGNMFVSWGEGNETPFDMLGSLRGPVIGFFGKDDENPSPRDVAKIGTRLTELNVEHEFHSYEGCGHAFQNFTNPQGYRAAATANSFEKMISWLASNL
ncbi:MAG: dienelactone hydrolase family protein [Pseudomonadota bacterium]|nr:dienelactone hydrolase family protein [Pseudomonadota bacterium]